MKCVVDGRRINVHEMPVEATQLEPSLEMSDSPLTELIISPERVSS